MSDVKPKFDQMSTDGSNQNDMGAAVAVEATAERLAKIFKLNVHCFEDLFEYLSLKVLKALRSTCKRMKQVVDYYIEMNFPVALQKITLYGTHGTWCSRQTMSARPWSEIGDLSLVKHLNIKNKRLTASECKNIQHILIQAESLQLKTCKYIRRNLYEDVLKHCSQLKHLLLPYNVEAAAKYGTEWRCRNYPALEHFGFYEDGFIRSETKYSELQEFFDQNPNVRTFTTTFDCIWVMRDWLLRSNIKLDRLGLIKGLTVNITDVFHLLDELHNRGFFQRLHVEAHVYSKDEFRQFTSPRSLECFHFWSHDIDYPIELTLSNVRELCFRFPRQKEN